MVIGLLCSQLRKWNMSEKWMPKSIESKKDVFQVKFHPAPLVYGYLERSDEQSAIQPNMC